MDVRLPNLGEDAESGTVASIFVKEGDVVETDQALIELESEKAVLSIPSPASGTVSKIHVHEGGQIRVGAVIVSLDIAGNGSRTSDTSGQESASAEPAEESKAVPARPTIGPISKPESPPQPPRELPEGVAPGASPSIRRMARDLGIDLRSVPGTARGGRIVLGDLRDYISRLQAGAASERAGGDPSGSRPQAVDFSRWGPIEARRATSLRKTIARRMVDSWTSIPHVFQFGDADITDLMALRKKHVPAYKEKGARLTLTPIVMKAVAGVLKRHPLINSSWLEGSDEIVIKEYFHFGLAIDTDAGLIVPVIRDVDRKSVFDLAREIEQLGERTRQRKVPREEMEGGTFTISNQGGIGGAHFTPIINKPEVAILGIGRGREILRQIDGTVQPRIMLPLTVSHDHRVIDGAGGVRFLTDLVEALEQFPESELKP